MTGMIAMFILLVIVINIAASVAERYNVSNDKDTYWIAEAPKGTYSRKKLEKLENIEGIGSIWIKDWSPDIYHFRIIAGVNYRNVLKNVNSILEADNGK